MNIATLNQKSQACLSQRVEIPGAPLWHMGITGAFGNEDSLELLQNTIDYLTCKGQIGLDFTDDEKEFMKELFEAMWWGGKVLGMKEAATLSNHYVNGEGRQISLPATVYSTSVIVKDVSIGMKKYIKQLHDDKKTFKQLKSSDSAFRTHKIAAPLLRGRRNANNFGYLLPEGVLLTEQKNKRLKNTDHRFILQASTVKSSLGFTTTWRVESIYDFEPFVKGDITHLELSHDLTLKLPDGLSHYLTKIGVAKSFKHYSQWTENWK